MHALPPKRVDHRMPSGGVSGRTRPPRADLTYWFFRLRSRSSQTSRQHSLRVYLGLMAKSISTSLTKLVVTFIPPAE